MWKLNRVMLLIVVCFVLLFVNHSQGRRVSIESTEQPIQPAADDYYDRQEVVLPDRNEDDTTAADDEYDITTQAHRSRCNCQRHRKMIEVGFDIAGNSIRRDVGQCKSTCHNRHHGNRAFKHQMSSSSSSKRRVEWCTCVAVGLRRENVYLADEVREMETVSECACVEKTPCRRMTKKMLLFDATPYRTEVDVGSCRGHCANSDVSCRPVRNRTVTVDGPNGGVCVNSIVECACVGQCYRMQHFDVFTDTIWNSTQNSSVQLLKELDVGRCVGQCDSSSGRSLCVMWDRKDNRKCLMSLTNRNSRCVASSYNSHVFTNVNGDLKTVLSIAQCACT